MENNFLLRKFLPTACRFDIIRTSIHLRVVKSFKIYIEPYSEYVITVSTLTAYPCWRTTKVRKFNKTGRSGLTDSVFASQRKGCGRYILVILMARVYPDMHAIKANSLLNYCYCT